MIPTSRFYGKNHKDACIPPNESEDERFSDEEDDMDDPTYVLPTKRAARSDVFESDSSEDGDSSVEDGDSSSVSTDSELPSTSRGKSSTKKLPKHVTKIDNSWILSNNSDVHDIPTWTGSIPPSTEVKAPITYFKNLLSDETLAMMVEKSNLYAVQKNTEKPLCVTISEMEQFLGISFYMSIIRLPNTRLYWNLHSKIPQVSDCMTRDRWEKIKSNLHVNDNQERVECDNANYDKISKIRPLMDNILLKMKNIPMEEMLSVDEQLIPFKGRSSLKQYNPKKPHRWGYKVFFLCGASGIVYNFETYTGKAQHPENLPDCGISGNVVIRLAQGIPRNLNHKLYFDNWFCSISLQTALANEGILCLGTVKGNRLQGCIMSSDKVLKEKGRGTCEERVKKIGDKKLILTKWMDSRAVHLLSSFVGAFPKQNVKRWDKSQRKEIEVECPSSVLVYNKCMGGVDLLDSLIGLYRTRIRSKKWYHRMIFHFMDLVCVVAWLLYKRDCDDLNIPRKNRLPLLDFKLSVAYSLTLLGKSIQKKRGRPSSQETSPKQIRTRSIQPNDDVRLDQTGHWPAFAQKKGRCKYPNCKGFPKVKCLNCEVYLCFTPGSNCFTNYHNT